MEEVPRVIWECLGDITVRARFVQVTTVVDLKRCTGRGLRRDERESKREEREPADIADGRFIARVAMHCCGC